ncbi:penicillin-binding protein activator [Alteromonadaceae bacterium BrNp21-10]|nr:penicillin-binding protein activator [Alteromonadaceae bacterium BrNp21-10]
MNSSKQWLIGGLICLLSACSSAPSRVVKTTKSSPLPLEEVSPEDTPETFLQKATLANNVDTRNFWLFKTAEAWQALSCDKSIKIIDILKPELITNIDLTQANLIEAECLYEMGFSEQAEKLASTLATQVGFDQRVYTLKAKLLGQKQQWLQAAQLWHKVADYNPAMAEHIWPLLKKMPLKEQEAASLEPGGLQPWLQLAVIIHKYASNAYRMAFEMQSWQARYPNHPAKTTLPKDLDLALHTEQLKPQKVAVILPLSGRLKPQGEALKQGLLSAYFSDENGQPELSFIDSTPLTTEALLAITEQHDFIVGPLQKEQIESLLPLLNPDKPMLALNRVSLEISQLKFDQATELLTESVSNQETTSVPLTNTPLTLSNKSNNTWFYALAPEDEAQQLASYLLDNGYKKPVVVASDSSAMQRMASTFIEYWQQHTKLTPAAIHFDSNKTMRTGVADLLDVNQSNARIRQVQRMHTQEVYAFYRNRQDIDAVVVFTNAEETELLVPIIESSISPFSEIIPVFGSSRSYHQNLKNNSLRDLRNLTFVDMPWMLPNHAWPELYYESTQLWPNRRDSSQRLFAMGYDAYKMIPHLKHMSILPELKMQGLTGQLSVDSHNVVHRQLTLGKVEQDQVIRIALD